MNRNSTQLKCLLFQKPKTICLLQNLTIMKSLLLLSVLTSFFFVETLSRKVLIKTVRLDSKATTQLELDIDAPFEIIEWKGNTIRVFTEIQLIGTSDKILSHLIAKGRYHMNIDQSKGKNNLRFSIPNLAKKVIINGDIVREEVFVKVMVPSSVLTTFSSRTLKHQTQMASN